MSPLFKTSKFLLSQSSSNKILKLLHLPILSGSHASAKATWEGEGQVSGLNVDLSHCLSFPDIWNWLVLSRQSPKNAWPFSSYPNSESIPKPELIFLTGRISSVPETRVSKTAGTGTLDIFHAKWRQVDLSRSGAKSFEAGAAVPVLPRCVCMPAAAILTHFPAKAQLTSRASVERQLAEK